MPEFALGLGQGLIEGGRNHVFDTDQTGVGRGGVINETLADVCRSIYQQCGKLGDLKNKKSRFMLTFIQM